MQVSVFSTVGNNEVNVNFEGSTWGELQDVLGSQNIVFKGMSAVVGESQVTLESRQAQTPATDFTLFLMPVDVKSGYSDEDYNNDDENYDDDNGSDALPAEAVISPESLLLIAKLEQANNLNNEVIATLKSRVITDPRTLSLMAQAAALRANRG